MTSCRNYCDVKRGDPEPEICTRTFVFCMLSKDETTNFGTGALCVLSVSVLHLGSKVNQSHYRPEVPRGFQEVKIPRLRDSGPGCW